MLNTQKTYELNVLVSGKAITEYEANNATFVEGRKGSDFEVQFKNKTHKRVLVVPAVDGRSVLDGKTATPDSKGYIVGPYGVLNIPGWSLDNDSVASFVFEDKSKSYASATSQGEVVQSGVVGVLVYGEVEKPTPVHHYHHYIKSPTITQWPYNTDPFFNTPIGGTADAPKGVMRGATTMNHMASLSTANVQLSNSTTATSTAVGETSDSFDMGAGFGARQNFKVTEQPFERSALQAQMSLYYDSRRNLEKRGIEVVKKETRHLNELPTAFSGIGCQPPKDWQG
jgi:hypothetical protein